MKDFINHILALYGKLTVTAIVGAVSLVSAWLFKRRRKKKGSSMMANIVGFSLAIGILGLSVGSTILAEIVYRWKKGEWSGEYMGRLKEALDQINKASQENRRLKSKRGKP